MRNRLIIAVVALVAFAALLTACGGTSSPSIGQQNANAGSDRAATYARAQAQVPNPTITNFPRRQTLADATKRQSLPDHPWYVYVLGMNGNIEYYFVAKSVPVNDCDYLSSAQSIQWDDNGNVVLQSPSLEGIYQSSSGCNTLTFFDAATDAEVQVTAGNSIILDRPLKVQAQPLVIKAKK